MVLDNLVKPGFELPDLVLMRIGPELDKYRLYGIFGRCGAAQLLDAYTQAQVHIALVQGAECLLVLLGRNPVYEVFIS